MFKSLYCPSATPDATIFKRLATPNGTLPHNGTIFYQDRETLPQNHRDSTKIVGGYLRPQIAQRLALGIGEANRKQILRRIAAEQAPMYVQNPPGGLPGHLGHCPPPPMEPTSNTRCGLVRELDNITKPVRPAFGPAGSARLDISQGNASLQMDAKRLAIPRHQRLVNQSSLTGLDARVTERQKWEISAATFTGARGPLGVGCLCVSRTQFSQNSSWPFGWAFASSADSVWRTYGPHGWTPGTYGFTERSTAASSTSKERQFPRNRVVAHWQS